MQWRNVQHFDAEIVVPGRSGCSAQLLCLPDRDVCYSIFVSRQQNIQEQACSVEKALSVLPDCAVGQ